MILFPAIDLKDGACVRLAQGDMNRATVYETDPAAQARRFAELGFPWLHMVDLNGAFEGRSVNGAAVDAILDATGLTGDILSRLHELIAGLQVFPERMRQNLELSGGMIMAEALMLELGATIGRQRAHDVVYDAAQAVATGDKTFRELLAESKELRDRFSAEEIDELLDPVRYTGQCAFMAHEQAALGRSLIAELRALPPAP